MSKHTAREPGIIANKLERQGGNAHKSRVQNIRNIQMRRGDDPCFATEKHFYCQETGCIWQDECDETISNWQL